jgi:hypothetical protein
LPEGPGEGGAGGWLGETGLARMWEWVGVGPAGGVFAHALARSQLRMNNAIILLRKMQMRACNGYGCEPYWWHGQW